MGNSQPKVISGPSEVKVTEYGVVKPVKTICHTPNPEINNIKECKDFANIVYFEGFDNGIDFSEDKNYKIYNEIIEDCSKLINTTFIWNGKIFDTSSFTSVIAEIMKKSSKDNTFISLIFTSEKTSSSISSKPDEKSIDQLREDNRYILKKYELEYPGKDEYAIDLLANKLKGLKSELDTINGEIELKDKQIADEEKKCNKYIKDNCNKLFSTASQNQICLQNSEMHEECSELPKYRKNKSEIIEKRRDPLQATINGLELDLKFKLQSNIKLIREKTILSDYGSNPAIKNFLDNWGYAMKSMEIKDNIYFV